ncbi:MAG: UDP-N-acetylglucosamine--N-acetylmuramyl-(pentapeptide) pyrophosphoryl-undecaprenol N-acetylglucosamine transferase [Acidimicrobiia bacterium]
MKIGVAAAGTGGHVFPALAVADGLRQRGFSHDDIVFFGGDRMEATTVPAAGYPFVGVEIHGIRRSLSKDNVTLPLKVKKARDVIVERIRTDDVSVMVVFGGYIAGPAALAASKAKIPLIVHEANAVPGVANRMIARRASEMYVAFAPAKQKLPSAKVIGSPLRSDIAGFDRDERRGTARRRYGIAADAKVLGVVGGSLGASFLNSVVDDLVGSERGFTILHITGRDHYEDIAHRSSDVDDWLPYAFEDDIADLYAASDVVMTRGGALTVSEVQATRTPAVVVPLPAGGGYQALNAQDAVAAGGAIVVEQTTPAQVAAVVRELVGDDLRIGAMRSAEASVDHKLATTIMVDTIVEAADA